MNQKPTSGLFTLFIALLAAASVYLALRNQQRATQEALEATVSAQFQKFGTAYQAQGHVVTDSQLRDLAKKTLGPEILREIKRQGGVIVSTVTASGTVPASASPPESVPTLPVLPGLPGELGWSGSVEQNRGGLPPLASIGFRYSRGSGLEVAWKNHPEAFKLAFAEWRTSEDGLRAAARLSRTVNGVTEEIPLDAADAYFPPAAIERLAPFPRYTLHTGAGMVDGRLHKVFMLQVHLNRNLSITSGYANGGPVLAGSYSWGKQ